jgi:hypothetical protein
LQGFKKLLDPGGEEKSLITTKYSNYANPEWFLGNSVLMGNAEKMLPACSSDDFTCFRGPFHAQVTKLVAVDLLILSLRRLCQAPWQVASAMNNSFNVKQCSIVAIENQMFLERSLDRIKPKFPQDRGLESCRAAETGHVCELG